MPKLPRFNRKETKNGTKSIFLYRIKIMSSFVMLYSPCLGKIVDFTTYKMVAKKNKLIKKHSEISIINSLI